MAKIALTQGSYESRSAIADAQRCVNLYAEKNPEDSPFPVTHYGTPGLDRLCDATSFTSRCAYKASDGTLFEVVGSKVYRILALGYARLSDQEKALMRHRFGHEPLRDDLIRLGNGASKVSNFARKKLLAVAKEHGVEEITYNFLLAAFRPERVCAESEVSQ
mgnify:CR=1 FL=1